MEENSDDSSGTSQVIQVICLPFARSTIIIFNESIIVSLLQSFLFSSFFILLKDWLSFCILSLLRYSCIVLTIQVFYRDTSQTQIFKIFNLRDLQMVSSFSAERPININIQSTHKRALNILPWRPCKMNDPV